MKRCNSVAVTVSVRIRCICETALTSIALNDVDVRGGNVINRLYEKSVRSKFVSLYQIKEK